MPKTATVLPPAEKLPLAVRKNIRDEFEGKKGDFEEKLTQILGVPWTIDIDPKAIYPYAEEDSWGQRSLGDCLKSYIEGAISGLEYFLKYHGDVGKDEINSLCTAHALGMDLDVQKKFTYNGCEVRDGKLLILFGEKYLGTNVSYSFEKLEDALNAAPQPDGASTLSYAARASIEQNYKGEEKIDKIQEDIAKQLHNDQIKLNPNFEQVFQKLKASKDASADFDKNLGSAMLSYFEALLSTLKYNKFEEDDMLWEGFAEAVDKGEITFRVVDKLVKGSYNEIVIEDGVLYLQTTPNYWWSNTSDIASKIVDIL